MGDEGGRIFLTEENGLFKLAIYSVIGDRSEQQDSVGYDVDDKGGLVVICDGMGGFEGGKKASSLAVRKFLDSYQNEFSMDGPVESIPQFLVCNAVALDQEVAELTDEDGNRLKAGSTLAAVLIKENMLFWVSVGDSRIYILRDEELFQITNDQNYLNLLNKQLKEGTITRERYQSELVKGEGLVSFLGIGGLTMIDYNAKPFSLLSGDQILIMTDGLYKLVPDHEVCSIISNFLNVSEAVEALDLKAKKLAGRENKTRDNMTLALLRVN